MVRLRIDRIATGGDGVARDDDGRVVFVAGALPGETVEARVTGAKKRFATAEVVQVVEAAPARVVPPCHHLVAGCGGCDLQHVAPPTQHELKVEIVADCLERIGRLASPNVTAGGALAPTGYRTTVRAAVVDGQAGHRRRRGHEVVATPECLVAHPQVRAVLAEGRFGDAEEVFVRASLATGERLVVVSPTAVGASVPAGAVIGADELDRREDAHLYEDVAGVRLRVSARSFFQSSPLAATALVEEVSRISDAVGVESLADLYGGIGVFAACVPVVGRVVLVEQNPWAVADARVNLAGTDAQLVEARVEAWEPEPVDLVVADPARRGLGAAGADVVARAGAPHVVLISCDPGSLGRDAGLLAARGFSLVESRVFDLFPQTSHVEVVSHFTRSEA